MCKRRCQPDAAAGVPRSSGCDVDGAALLRQCDFRLRQPAGCAVVLQVVVGSDDFGLALRQEVLQCVRGMVPRSVLGEGSRRHLAQGHLPCVRAWMKSLMSGVSRSRLLAYSWAFQTIWVPCLDLFRTVWPRGGAQHQIRDRNRWGPRAATVMWPRSLRASEWRPHPEQLVGRCRSWRGLGSSRLPGEGPEAVSGGAQDSPNLRRPPPADNGSILGRLRVRSQRDPVEHCPRETASSGHNP